MTQNNPFRRGLSESKMWEEYNAVCKRLELAQNGRKNVPYREWCKLVNLECEMRRFLNAQMWGEYEPLNLPKTADEKLAALVAMPSEEKHRLFLCDFSKYFEFAKGSDKSSDKTWAFERAFNQLKSYKKTHSWDNAYIERVFGVSFKQAKDLYYRLKK